MAIQECFPSSLYIMDEIDANLDSHTVQRVAALLKEKSLASGSQFIVISHRNEMQAIASNLIGIYSCDQRPNSISFYHE
jgi:chromosome segregation ATPase